LTSFSGEVSLFSVSTTLRTKENTMKFSRRSAVLGFALLALIATAAPSALAVTPEVDGGGTNVSAHSAGSTMTMNGEPTITCATGFGSGKRISSTTGEGELLMTGCHTFVFGFKVNCTSEGKPGGQIVVQNSVTHLVYLDENHTKVGALATPPASGVFTKFTCAGISTIEVKGNGVLGEVTSPKCGQTSTSATVVARATGSTQEYRQIEETGTFYELKAATSGGEFKSAGTNWTVTGKSVEAGTLTCPEQK
jgi:hypothetical protein